MSLNEVCQSVVPVNAHIVSDNSEYTFTLLCFYRVE